MLKTPVKPDHITILSIVPAIFASYFFIKGGYRNIVIGASLAFLYLILDLVDGEIARAKNISTIRGRWVDGIIGFVTYPLFIFSLAFGLKTYMAMVFGSFVTGLAIFAVSYGAWQSWWMGTIWLMMAFGSAVFKDQKY